MPDLASAANEVRGLPDPGLAERCDNSTRLVPTHLLLNAGGYLASPGNRKADRGARGLRARRGGVSDRALRELFARHLPERAPLVEVPREPSHHAAKTKCQSPSRPRWTCSFFAEHRKPPVQFRLELVPGFSPRKYRCLPIQP
jgi:hypothetical protein